MKNNHFLFLLVIVLLAIAAAFLFSPKLTDWTPTYSRYDTGPYGCYVLFEELDEIFPNAEVHIQDTTDTKFFSTWEKDSSALVIIDENYQYFPSILDSFVYQGNEVFISAKRLNRYTNLKFREDSLHVWLYKEDIINSENDFSKKEWFSAILHNSSFTDTVKIPKTFSQERIITDSTLHYQLGEIIESTESSYYDSIVNTNFIRVPFGKGNYFFYSTPEVFTNQALLYDSLSNYSSSVLSYLAPGTKHVIWNEFEKPGNMFFDAIRKKPESPYQFLFTRPMLKLATIVFLIGIGLLVFVRSKREQQVIPIIQPPKNRSLDFIKTISKFYLEKSENKNLAKKRMDYFEHTFNKKYGFPIQDFENKEKELEKITSIEKELIQKYFSKKRMLDKLVEITPDQLKSISQVVEKIKL